MITQLPCGSRLRERIVGQSLNWCKTPINLRSFLQWKTAKQLEVNKAVNHDLMLKLHEMKRKRLRTVYGGVALSPFHGAVCHQTSLKVLRAKSRKHQYTDMQMISTKIIYHKDVAKGAQME